MNKTCCKILLSTLPWCITTRTALLSIPFGACNSSYIYRMITDLIDRKYLAERNVVTKIDVRKYSHSYLSLTKNGLTALVDCYSANREIAIGSIWPEAIGYDFLTNITSAPPLPVQTPPNAQICSILREKEMEAHFMRSRVVSMPFERPSLQYIAHKHMVLDIKAPNKVSAIVLGALKQWMESHPVDIKSADSTRRYPVFYPSHVIRLVVDQNNSSHRDFTSYDGVVYDGTSYLTIFHSGPRGVAWAADANRRLCAYLDRVFHAYQFRHNAVLFYKNNHEWMFIWNDPLQKRRSNPSPKMAFGAPYGDLVVIPFDRENTIQLEWMIGKSREGYPVKEMDKFTRASLKLAENQNEKKYYVAFLPEAHQIEKLLDCQKKGITNFAITALEWQKRELERLFPQFEIISCCFN